MLDLILGPKPPQFCWARTAVCVLWIGALGARFHLFFCAGAGHRLRSPSGSAWNSYFAIVAQDLAHGAILERATGWWHVVRCEDFELMEHCRRDCECGACRSRLARFSDDRNAAANACRCVAPVGVRTLAQGSESQVRFARVFASFATPCPFKLAIRRC
jgi:hypothetical protein